MSSLLQCCPCCRALIRSDCTMCASPMSRDHMKQSFAMAETRIGKCTACWSVVMRFKERGEWIQDPHSSSALWTFLISEYRGTFWIFAIWYSESCSNVCVFVLSLFIFSVSLTNCNTAQDSAEEAPLCVDTVSHRWCSKCCSCTHPAVRRFLLDFNGPTPHCARR